MPVRRRPHRVLIPRRAFDPRSAPGQRRQQKLPLLGNEVAMQVQRIDMTVRRQLFQWSRIRRHAKLQQPRLVPHFDRLDKWPGRKNAMPHRADSMPGNLRANWIRNPRAKQQFFRRRYLCERHDLIPNFLRRRVHLDRRPHLRRRRLQRRGVLDSKRRWNQQNHDRQHRRRLLRAPVVRLNRVAQHPAQRR